MLLAKDEISFVCISFESTNQKALHQHTQTYQHINTTQWSGATIFGGVKDFLRFFLRCKKFSFFIPVFLKVSYFSYFSLLYSYNPVEHRPFVFSFHRWRFLAWACSSPNDVFPHSARTVRLQVALGRPRDLLPCGFHSNTLWQILFSLFRRVCPSQPYFLRFISTSISDCPVLSHSSWLVIIYGNQCRVGSSQNFTVFISLLAPFPFEFGALFTVAAPSAPVFLEHVEPASSRPWPPNSKRLFLHRKKSLLKRDFIVWFDGIF